jgi:capsular polysaccharide biosynthesis protein/Mrp family chromosome partitioning ATPase
MPQQQPAARRQLEFVKRQGILVMLVTVTALAAAGVASFSQEKVYRASTKIVVGQGGGIFQPQFGNVFQPFTQTMSSLLKSQIVAETVIADLGLDETPKSLLSRVDVSSTADSAVLEVTFDSNDRAEAVRILGRMAAVFTSLVRQKLGGAQQRAAADEAGALPPITATVFDPAHAPATPISPQPTRTLAFAAIIALVLGIILGLLRDALDDRLHGRDDVEEHFGAPVVAALPKSMLGRGAVEPARRRLDAFRRSAERKRRRIYAEAVDPLVLQLSRNGARETLIVITSSVSGEGKSTVAAHVSVALALAGQDVICVDADPSRPRLSHYLDLDRGESAAVDWQRGQFDLHEALREVSLPDGSANGVRGRTDAWKADEGSRDGDTRHRAPGRIQLLRLGDERPAPIHRSIADVVEELKALARYVVVDAPPLNSATALALVSLADETIVVARDERTTKEQARFVRQTLARIEVPRYSVVSIGSH